MNKIDIKYFGIPNICFSLTDKTDKREKEFIEQRIERGFDDSETWSLSDTIANFIIPRLKRFEEITKDFSEIKKDFSEIKQDFSETDGEFMNNVASFRKAMELVSRDEGSRIFTEEERYQVSEGLEKFPKIFMNLWR